YEGRNVVSMGAVYLGPVARFLGLLAMTTGEDERALGHLETARAAAERMGARPIVVLAALDAAEVLARRAAQGDAQRGRALVQRAAGEAAQLGMDGALARADALLARLEDTHRPARRPGAVAPRRAVLRREQDVWLLEYDGRSACLHDAKGLHHLATLFERPGTSIASLALADAIARGHEREASAVVAYRAQVREVREELAEAQAFNDPERVSRAREQLELVAAEVEQAGEATSAASERARINVTRAIKAAVRRIAEQEPDLGHVLRGTVRTGTSCRYEPDPGAPLTWEVER
ncbi:MAG TPA: hypothetical protein VGV90_12700, partial [Solirubrobacteraceae bacterium]|nr:hypothetical protein [Solirubrobacteraceae bacterium]